jgi:hypothetical protein
MLIWNPCVYAAAKYKGTETEIKAAYLYNFALFTKWPAIPTEDGPFKIGILGDEKLTQEAERSLSKAKVGARPVKIVKIEPNAEAPGCHILYVASGVKELPAILERVKGKNILTVSDDGLFCEKGGCIQFERGARTVGLAINRRAAERQKLTISSDLLAIARIVDRSSE